MEPPWRRVVDRYLDALAYERGLSENTVAAYRRDLAPRWPALPVTKIRTRGRLYLARQGRRTATGA